MGILRTDTISGLETPTPVTGSVSFDGGGDYLSIPSSGDFAFANSDFTIELWTYITNTSGAQGFFDMRPSLTQGVYPTLYHNSGVIKYFTNSSDRISGDTLSSNTWHHIAVCRSGTNTRLFVNGIQQSSTYSDSNSYLQSGMSIGSLSYDPTTYEFYGYISNLRVLKGTALYTSNFTPPVNELEVIVDTVLLCCKNSSSAAVEATGKTITVNGNAVASSVSPGLTRDFTYGTQFNGVTKFDTQGYFIPPSGTTAQRYVNDIVTSCLVLNLDAGNLNSYPGSGTTWTDLSGSGNNGTLTNGPTYSGANRGSIVFDGVDDNVSRTSFNTGQNFTVSAWIYPTLLGTTRRAIVANSYPYATRTGWLLCTGGALGTNTFFLSIGADVAYNGAASNSLELNKWQFVVATVTNGGESILLYVNSVLVGSSASALNSGTITYTDSQFYVGYRHTTNTDPYSGNISQVSIYNRALTPEEVSQNFNALRSRYGI